MNTERFIAMRLIRSGKGSFSTPMTRIAIVSVALGVAVMVVAMSIVRGFQSQIRDKVSGFGAHIQIARFDSNQAFEFEPFEDTRPFVAKLPKIAGIKHVQVFATKAGIVKTDDQIQGLILKGAGNDFDWRFFDDKMVAGRHFTPKPGTPNDSIVISASLARLLKLKLNDALRMYFIIDNQARGRKFIISGIYETGLGDFDLRFAFCDIAQIRKLNDWDSSMISGIEITVDQFKDLDHLSAVVYNLVDYDLNTKTIRQLYPQMFDWLALQDINAFIILVLMVTVSVMAMISTLLILILERTRMIGILKALGATNGNIRKVFLIHAAYITGLGLLWGNMAGIGFLILQWKFKWVSLPSETYFMNYVPVDFNLWNILAINAGTMLLCWIFMLLPSLIISRISPVKAIRFD